MILPSSCSLPLRGVHQDPGGGDFSHLSLASGLQQDSLPSSHLLSALKHSLEHSVSCHLCQILMACKKKKKKKSLLFLIRVSQLAIHNRIPPSQPHLSRLFHRLLLCWAGGNLALPPLSCSSCSLCWWWGPRLLFHLLQWLFLSCLVWSAPTAPSFLCRFDSNFENMIFLNFSFCCILEAVDVRAFSNQTSGRCY